MTQSLQQTDFRLVKLSRKLSSDEDFQMAPMIDMVFLLLVFFMTVSTLAQEERVPLELPESAQANIREEHAGRGTLSLDWAEDGSVVLYVGAFPATIDQMQAQIRDSLRSNPDLEINVRANSDMPFVEIRKVLQACAEAGAHKVIYATYQSH